MGRIRSIKPELPQSESIGRLSRDARLLFIQLWTIVDDEGRARASAKMLASLLYPYDEDARSLIDGWLTELEREQMVVRYQVDGNSYLEIRKWRSHQKIEKPTTSKLPAPPKEDSPDTPRNIPDKSTLDKEGKGKDQEGKGGDGAGESPTASGEDFEDATLVWQFFSTEAQVFGMFTSVAVTRVAEAELAKGRKCREIADEFIASWRDYDTANREGRLQRMVKAETFFNEGHWSDHRKWAWRKGNAPPPKSSSIKPYMPSAMEQAYLDQVMREKAL